MNRRSFFQGIVKAAAIIALAPQIAFRAPRLRWGGLQWRSSEIGIREMLIRYTAKYDGSQKLDLDDYFKTCYDLKRARERDGQNEITFIARRDELPQLKRLVAYLKAAA